MPMNPDSGNISMPLSADDVMEKVYEPLWMMMFSGGTVDDEALDSICEFPEELEKMRFYNAKIPVIPVDVEIACDSIIFSNPAAAYADAKDALMSAKCVFQEEFEKHRDTMINILDAMASPAYRNDHQVGLSDMNNHVQIERHGYM